MSSTWGRKKKRQLPRARKLPSSSRPFLLAVVPDAVDGADEVVGNEQRTVPILLDVNRAAEIVAVVIPAFSKRDRRSGDMAVILEEGHHETRANRHGTVPRAVLGREDRPLVLRRELVAGVEGEAEVGRVCDLLDFGEHGVSRRRLVLELVGPGMTAAVPREPELLALLIDAVHLPWRGR